MLCVHKKCALISEVSEYEMEKELIVTQQEKQIQTLPRVAQSSRLSLGTLL